MAAVYEKITHQAAVHLMKQMGVAFHPNLLGAICLLPTGAKLYRQPRIALDKDGHYYSVWGKYDWLVMGYACDQSDIKPYLKYRVRNITVK